MPKPTNCMRFGVKSHSDVLWAHISLATSESFSVLPETHNFVHPGILFFFYLASHWLISTVWPPEWSMFEPVKSDRNSFRLFYCIYEKLFYAQRCPSGNLVTSGSQRYAAVPHSSHRVGVFLVFIKISWEYLKSIWKVLLNFLLNVGLKREILSRLKTVPTFQLVFLRALESTKSWKKQILGQL